MGEVHCLGPLFIWTEVAASSRIQSLTRKLSGIAVRITYSPFEGTINEEGRQSRQDIVYLILGVDTWPLTGN